MSHPPVVNPYIAGALAGLLLIFSVWFTGIIVMIVSLGCQLL